MFQQIRTNSRFFLAAITAVALLATLSFAQTAVKPPNAAPAAPAATPAPAEAPADNPQPNNTTSFLKLLTRGGWAMWPLAACSLIGLALIIERGLALRRREILPPGFMEGLNKIYHGTGDTDAAIDYCKRQPSSIARIMAAGLRKLPDSTVASEQALADQGAAEIARLRRNLRMLHGVAAITPTLGLLGTVTGMIRRFEVASSVGLGHSEMLMHGIYEALVATMTGLLIAVPVLFAYYFFLGIIDRTILELNDTCQAFMDDHQNKTRSVSDGQQLIPDDIRNQVSAK